MIYDMNDPLPLALGEKIDPIRRDYESAYGKGLYAKVNADHPAAIAWAGSIGITDGDMKHPSAQLPPRNPIAIGVDRAKLGSDETVITINDDFSRGRNVGGLTAEPGSVWSCIIKAPTPKWKVGDYCDHEGADISGGIIKAIYSSGDAELNGKADVQYRHGPARGLYLLPLAELLEHIPF